MRIVATVALLLAGFVPCFGQIEQIRTVLQKASNRYDPSLLDMLSLELADDQIRAIELRDIQGLQPLLEKCLSSPDERIQNIAGAVLLGFTLRLDGGQVMEPYVDYFAANFTSSNRLKKKQSIALLALGLPKPGKRASAALAAHFEDPENNAEEFSMFGKGILYSYPEDAEKIRYVLHAVRQRNDPEITRGFIQGFGLEHSTNELALEFIREGLSNPRTRAVSLEAIERLPVNTRGHFDATLLRIAADPDEKKADRDAAQKLLKR